MHSLRRFAFPIVVLLAAVAAPACSDGDKAGPEELCTAYQECFDDQTGGPSPEFYDQCLDAIEQQLETLEGTACEDAYEDMIDCAVDNFNCNDFGNAACENEIEDFGTCDGSPQPGF